MADPTGPTPIPTPALLRPDSASSVGVQRPIPITPGTMRPHTPLVVAHPPTEVVEVTTAFGRVDEAGNVYLIAPEGEIQVGQWAAGPPAEGLAFFRRKYEDLVVEIDLIRQRLADGRATPTHAQPVLTKVREGIAARSFVGDIVSLESKCAEVADAIAAARVIISEQRAAARAAATVAREALAVEAEKLGVSTSWKPTSERFVALVEEWKVLPHADRTTEQALWKRISAARTGFDKRRRAHFVEFEAQNKVATTRKRELIAAAEALISSTDWNGTGRKLRDLMGEWKAAPRAGRTDEDKLWKRFKAAQDAFYAAKTASEEQAEEALRPNIAAKEALVVQAEALLPITDQKNAKSSLRAISDQWERVGDLPRTDRERLESRMRRVEEAIRKVEADSWKKSNPEARARAESTANAFAEGIAKLESKRAAAAAKGNEREVIKLDASIEQTRTLLAAAEAAVAEFSGLVTAN